MPLDRMKAIDKWLGLPLCVCLGVLVRLFAKVSARAHEIPANPRRLLVMKFFGMGSVIQASPMLRAIRQRYPGSALIFLTFDRTAGPVERLGVCTAVWQIRTDGLLHFGWDVVRLLPRFLRDPIDVCIDLEVFSRFATLMSVLTRAPVRVAFQLNHFWRQSLVTHPVYYNYYRHIADTCNDAAAAIGAVVTDTRPCRLTVDASAARRCQERLRDAGWNARERLVGFNINAGELSVERRWPRERFAVLIERLVADATARSHGLRVVLTGAPDEAEYVNGLVCALSDAARRSVINMAGRLSFDEFVASMDLYELFVTNDSGPLHVAYAQGVPTVSLWGPGRPDFYGPLGGPHRTLYKPLPCSPCLYLFTTQVGQWCDHRADCMWAIEVEEVWAAMQETLRGAREESLGIAATHAR